jgi:hypothetical protein
MEPASFLQALCEAIGASLDDSRHSASEYSLLCSSTLWDIHVFVFIKSSLKSLVRHLRSGTEVRPVGSWVPTA